jgi:hypothetical protein
VGAGTASRGHDAFVFDRLFLPMLLSPVLNHLNSKRRMIVSFDHGQREKSSTVDPLAFKAHTFCS